MNRFLAVASLLFSLCALLTIFWLWREVRALRSEAASPPPHHRITDEQFGRIKEFVTYVHTTFDETHLPRSSVLTADQLLNKARYMHGDISREEWYRLHNETEGERMRLDIARFQAGAGTLAAILLLQDDVLESSR